MTQALLHDVETVLGGFEAGSHIGVTELRSKRIWEESFNKLKMLEILDRNETFGILLKPELINSLKAYIEQLEQRLEQAQLDALFARREGKMNWTTGEDLKQKAKESFRARKDLIKGILDGDQ